MNFTTVDKIIKSLTLMLRRTSWYSLEKERK